MVVETSPYNYQVWILSNRFLSIAEKRYWLKKLCNDPGAGPNNRWGRCPGFRNRKQKHKDSKGGYPLAKLIWVDWKNKALIPQVKSCCPDNTALPLAPFPLNPWRGECALINIFPVPIMIKVMNQKLILLMHLHLQEEIIQNN